jgi:hypothetical protein
LGLAAPRGILGPEGFHKGREVSRLRARSMSAGQKHKQERERHMSNQPVHKVKIGLIHAAIWENDGFNSVEFSRSYKTSDGEWKNTSSFSQGDLLNLSKCAERAELWVSRKASERQ